MARFLLRRIGALVVILFALSVIVFALLDLAPGSTEELLLRGKQENPQFLEAIRSEYHLDQPFTTRYVLWLGDAVRLDFGRSARSGAPVLEAILERMLLSLELAVFAFILAVGFGLALGMIAAHRKRSRADRAIVGLGVIAAAAPAFATGLLLLYVFGVQLGWLPVFGNGTGLRGRISHLTLPAIALALTAMALIIKLTRAAIIETLEKDYVAFARARGVSRTRILLSYTLRNSLVPVVTSSGLILGSFLAGAVLVETTFALSGAGSLLVDSVRVQDIPMVQGLVLIIAAMIILINLLTDLVYPLIDPRISLTHKRR
jgi:peptide/nickel transport system permease protein